MKIDYEKLKAAFPGRAWVYAEGHDSVKITKWTGDGFVHPVDGEYLTLLRVFDSERELLFVGGKCRDTADYDMEEYITDTELTETAYVMYGEYAETANGVTLLREARGGVLVFPSELNFPKTAALPDGVIGLKLGIRNYVRYNPVPVLPKVKKYDCGLRGGESGAIEVVDYAYTGFYYVGAGKEVEL